MMTSLECSSSARKRCSLAPGACASAPRSEGVTGLAMVIPGANTHPVGCPGQPPGRGGGGVTDVTAGRSCRVRLGGRLVQDEPVEPELADGLDELTEIHGLADVAVRSEEHTSELQSQSNLVCRLLLEKKKKLHPTLVDNDSLILSELLPSIDPRYLADRSLAVLCLASLYP